MKTLLGIVMGAGLMLGGVAFAQEKTGIISVGGFDTGYSPYRVSKIYDQDNGVVCYTFVNRYDTAAISCLHN